MYESYERTLYLWLLVLGLCAVARCLLLRSTNQSSFVIMTVLNFLRCSMPQKLASGFFSITYQIWTILHTLAAFMEEQVRVCLAHNCKTVELREVEVPRTYV